MIDFFSTAVARRQYRILAALLFLVSYGLVVAAIIIGEVYHLKPCPLCIFQRIAFLLVGTVALLGWIFPTRRLGWRRLHVLMVFLLSSVGAGIAGWHVYLQYSPPALTCGPDLKYMVSHWALSRWLPIVFKGEGECTKIDWTFLSLSIPTWSVICFSIIIIASLWYLFRTKR